MKLLDGKVAAVTFPSTGWAARDDALFGRVLDTNLKGTFCGCRAAARVMLPRGSGSIINVSSIAGLAGTAGNPASPRRKAASG